MHPILLDLDSETLLLGSVWLVSLWPHHCHQSALYKRETPTGKCGSFTL